MDLDDTRKRIAAMLQSIGMANGYPDDKHAKADVMRALLGSIKPPNAESDMLAVCECG